MKKILPLILIFIFSVFGCTSNSVKKAVSPNWKSKAIGGFSNVHIYVPKKKSPVGSGRSLMIVLHGCLQPASAFTTANLDTVAEKYGMVIALPDAKYPTGLGCWDFLDNNKKRNKGDYENIIYLVEQLTAQKDLSIDNNQVYIAGLSSGGSYAMITGCLAPDVFAGVAVFAAPSGGVETEESAIEVQSDHNSAARDCVSYSKEYEKYFASQLFVVAHGTDDSIVTDEYLDINAGAMAKVYGLSDKNISPVKDIGNGVKETIYGSGRVAKLNLHGIPHEWTAGKGSSGEYINNSAFNFGAYIADFFLMNNGRAQ